LPPYRERSRERRYEAIESRSAPTSGFQFAADSTIPAGGEGRHYQAALRGADGGVEALDGSQPAICAGQLPSIGSDDSREQRAKLTGNADGVVEDLAVGEAGHAPAFAQQGAVARSIPVEGRAGASV
jgi:hypothetical protein